MEISDGYYTYTTLGPAHPNYRGSGFTEAQVSQLGEGVIAHFMGPFAKRNGQRFYNSKLNELGYHKFHGVTHEEAKENSQAQRLKPNS